MDGLEDVDIELYKKLLSESKRRKEMSRSYYDVNRETILRKHKEAREQRKANDPVAYRIHCIKTAIQRNEERLISGAEKGERYLNAVTRRLNNYEKQLDELLAQKMQTDA